ncbi:Uncharacterised protein [Streptococcus pneumoniae]|nr:Uncharacterised protein [Streptococcus pneumoniae]
MALDLVLDALADRGVHVLPVLEGAGLDVLADALQRAGHGLHEVLALLGREDLADEGAGLTEVVVVRAQGLGLAGQGAVGLPAVVHRAGLVRPGVAVGVRRVGGAVAGVVVPHLAVEGVVVHRVLGTVHRQLVHVGAHAVQLCVVVREGAAQEHAVRGEADARHGVARAERGGLDLREVVLRVAVQGQRADLDARVVLLGDRLRQVEGVEPVGLALLVGDRLDVEVPLGVVALGDGLEQVLAVEVGVLAGDLGGLVVREVVHALLGDEVVLHPVLLALGVDPQVGVGAVAVHLTPGAGQAARAHQVGHLVRRLGVVGPEVPLHGGIAQAGVRQTLLRADEVGELHRVAQEEDRGVVADDVVVALLGVEAQCEAAHVAPGVRGAELAGHGGEAQEGLGLRARLEHEGLGVLRHVLGHLELAEGAGALGVRAALRDVHAVEVLVGLQQVGVVQDDGPLAAHGQGLAVADGRGAVLAGGTGRVRGLLLVLRHGTLLRRSTSAAHRSARWAASSPILAYF